MSTSKRSAGSSIGPKILLAAVVVVAGVIGISGIYPQVIDAEWMQDNGTHLPILSLPTSATTKPSSTAAALPLRGRHAVTTGQAVAVSQPRPAGPAAAVSQPRASVAAVAPLPTSPPPTAPLPAPTAAAAVTVPLALAEIPDAEAKAEAPATESSPAKAVDKQTKVVKRKVAQHHRSFAGAYAQYGGWGGWGGWSGFGGYRRY